MSSASSSHSVLLNRELSLLKFNERVLAMAENPATPLLERLRYLCIVSSNLDEFFEIRISSLKEQQRQNPGVIGADGMTPAEAFEQVQTAAHDLIDRQNALLTKQVLPRLRKEGIDIMEPSAWSEALREWAHAEFYREVMPMLTPIGLDPAHPFPRVYNKSLNFIVSLSGNDAFGRSASIAIVQAPRALPRIMRAPSSISGVPHGYILLSALISAFVGDIFPGLNVQGVYQWRVTRNSDLFVDEEEITNLRQALQGELSQRNFGAAVRLEIDHIMPEALEAFLQQEFLLQPQDTYRVSGPVNLSRLMQLCNVVDRPDLLFPVHRPHAPAPFDTVMGKPGELFAAIAQKDRLLHHPYQSFQPVLDFLTAAATDPSVAAIKQTIYRTGEDSELMRLLLAAARAGKEVTVVVELMARFDEQTNINWAARLEEVGAHVSYGVVGHKTHAKMALVLRREKGQIRRYGHLGTGNYHPRTAKLYTDFGLLTANPQMCLDMDKVFSLLTGLGARRPLSTLLQSPFTLHETMMALIRAETAAARAGRKARIMAKMNSLLEPEIIEALYAASTAGVHIDLIVRGACALRAGVPGLSDNIRLRSIIGRFLEHARVFYFYSGGEEKVYLSSADWMDRNFFRRVEVGFPILDSALKKRVINESFTLAMRDNQLAWRALPDGTYAKVRGRGKPVNLHESLLQTLG
ncbi:polyphosphate kinase 1 [Allopusillimonas soli]|uniref:Polyphosphate kinase n=1 Tax=Allopusillimonas soli TaxID=659016 RepID=A0A853FEV3_9BURK|nr:polyphosphate kinase 1 [Allopusillimonas soli]NYT38583.1 polyphosphate kinase 1 [Allopusillimonas soli]TEA71702.1 polyphosphate kinase 1 [Allopusillimonas soli]